MTPVPVPFAWTHDPGPRSQRRWRNSDSGKLRYMDAPPRSQETDDHGSDLPDPTPKHAVPPWLAGLSADTPLAAKNYSKVTIEVYHPQARDMLASHFKIDTATPEGKARLAAIALMPTEFPATVLVKIHPQMPETVILEGLSRAAKSDVVLHVDAVGMRHCELDLIKLPHRLPDGSANPCRGKGLELFVAMTKGLRAARVQTIKLHAAGDPASDDFNGYYTWPRWGFSGKISTLCYERLPAELQQQAQRREILDLLRTRDGRDWWRAYGSSIYPATFDMDGQSRNMQVLRSYIQERKDRQAAGFVQELLQRTDSELVAFSEEMDDLGADQRTVGRMILEELVGFAVPVVEEQAIWLLLDDLRRGVSSPALCRQQLALMAGETVEDYLSGPFVWFGAEHWEPYVGVRGQRKGQGGVRNIKDRRTVIWDDDPRYPGRTGGNPRPETPRGDQPLPETLDIYAREHDHLRQQFLAHPVHEAHDRIMNRIERHHRMMERFVRLAASKPEGSPERRQLELMLRQAVNRTTRLVEESLPLRQRVQEALLETYRAARPTGPPQLVHGQFATEADPHMKNGRVAMSHLDDEHQSVPAKVTAQVREQLRHTFEHYAGAVIPPVSKPIPGFPSRAQQQRMTDNLRFLGQLTNKEGEQPLQPLGVLWTRNAFTPSYNWLSQHIMGNADGMGAQVIISHEIGHHLEETIPSIRRAAVAWIDHRAGGEEPRQLSTSGWPGMHLQPPAERGVIDHFTQEALGLSAGYIGKFYDTAPSIRRYLSNVGKKPPPDLDDQERTGMTRRTEVVSVLIERLCEDPGALARHDPDAFHFILGVLNGPLRRHNG